MTEPDPNRPIVATDGPDDAARVDPGWERRLLEAAPAAPGLRMAEWAQRI